MFMVLHRYWLSLGALGLERTTAIYSRHSVFVDRFIVSLNFRRMRLPREPDDHSQETLLDATELELHYFLSAE